MRIIRGQAFVRAWPAGYGETVGKAAMVGFVEMEGQVDDEMVHGVAMLGNGDGITLTATGTRLAPEYDFTDCDIDAILRSHSWPRPEVASGMDGGGLLLRRTRVASGSGTIFILIGLMSTDALRDQTMVQIAGDAEGVMVVWAETCARSLKTNGSTLSQVLKLPMWGWGEEPWGIVCTLNLATIDECRRYEELLAGEPEKEPGEREALERGRPGSVFYCSRTDSSYQRFKAEWLRRYGPAEWDGVHTASDQAEGERRATEIVRALKDEMYA